MRSLRNGIGFLLSAAILAAPGTTQAQSALLEKAVGLSGLATFMESGAVGMVERTALDAAIGFDETSTMNTIDSEMFSDLTEGANGLTASLATR